jgi:hypothetical protein
MVLRDLYSDIISTLNFKDVNKSPYYYDVVKAINDAIRTQRIEYIQNGMGGDFYLTQTFYFSIKDQSFPFLNWSQLDNEIINDVPIELALINAFAYRTKNKLTNTVTSYNKGDIAIKDGKTYKCIESYSDLNTYSKIFRNREVKNYYKNNGLNYKAGDIIYDVELESYYKALYDYEAGNTNAENSVVEVDDGQGGTTTESVFEKLYWREIGNAYYQASYYPFSKIHQMRLFENSGSYVYTINKNKIYVSPNINQFVLTYIPKWEQVDELDAEVDIPEYMVSSVKSAAVRKLAIKLQIQLPEREQKDNE